MNWYEFWSSILKTYFFLLHSFFQLQNIHTFQGRKGVEEKDPENVVGNQAPQTVMTRKKVSSIL